MYIIYKDLRPDYKFNNLKITPLTAMFFWLPEIVANLFFIFFVFIIFLFESWGADNLRIRLATEGRRKRTPCARDQVIPILTRTPAKVKCQEKTKGQKSMNLLSSMAHLLLFNVCPKGQVNIRFPWRKWKRTSLLSKLLSNSSDQVRLKPTATTNIPVVCSDDKLFTLLLCALKEFFA